MTPDKTTQGDVDHTGPQSQTVLPPEPQSQVQQSPAPQNQSTETAGASDASQPSQPSQPSQTGAEPIVMGCCQKTRKYMRDCECAVPQGPCQAPPLVFSHYRDKCKCHSCKWLRETKKLEIRDQIPGREGHTAGNPTFAGNKVDEVLQTQMPIRTNLELVYPVLLKEKPQQQWEWVFYPVEETQLPFLASPSKCAGVLRVTLDSSGDWKALRANGTSFYLHYDTRPVTNELYSDYGYAPGLSPYGSNGENGSKLTPDQVNSKGYVPRGAPNKSREDSASRHNMTLFIGGIDETVTTQEVRELFMQFGQINYVNRPHQTNAFVQYALRRDALMAMRQMQGVPIKSCRLRISWGDPTIKNQWTIKEKNGRTPFKGNKHQQIRKNEKNPGKMPQHSHQNQWHQHQGLSMSGPSMSGPSMSGPSMSGPSMSGPSMSGPWNPQRQYQMSQMAYPPVQVWYPAQMHQYQQQMGYGFQYPAYPPPPQPPIPSAEQNPQPALPESTTSNQAFRLDPSASSWKGNLKGKGPVIASSDLVPNPNRQSQDQPAPRTDSTSSLESHQTKASSGDGQSQSTTPRTSPEIGDGAARDSRTVMGVEGELENELQEPTTSTRKRRDTR